MELVGRGMIPRLLERRPGPDEARIRLGEAAAARAREIDRAAAGRVREGHQAGRPGRLRDQPRVQAIPRVPIRIADHPDARVEVAVAAVLGAAEQLKTARAQPVPTAAVRGVRSGLADRLRRRAARIIARGPSHAAP